MFIVGNYLLILTCLIQTPSYAQQHLISNSSCNPSACGNIPISYPFRLKDDPKYCGHHNRSYELSCENNTTASVYIDQYKYHVRAINYLNYTIRVVDPSIKNNDSCSFPTYSPKWEELVSYYKLMNSYNVYYSPYPAYVVSIDIYSEGKLKESGMVRPVNFLSCSFPPNDPVFIETSQCVSLSSNTSRHTHIKAGYMDLNDPSWDMCTIDLVVMTSLPFVAKNDLSLSKIHDSLVYGFELSWSAAFCECNEREYCWFDGINAACTSGVCNFSYRAFAYDLSHRIFARYPFRRHGLCYEGHEPRYYETLVRTIVILVYCTQLYLVLRILMGLPFLIGLIIYKFRRRHLSMFDLIEGFLQSDNNLMPIRYSYSDVKKMTRGFREKLGQGGYGSVYKGKLRSGNIAAVKVLSKPSTNGQEFINEVATMGRIHHINVVKLVGYCAERSKCALVYDFMPNGSLEKYIYSEKTNGSSLSWDKKYEIAVGVARGIEYLHRGCDIQILHFDIKPHNILLDDNFNPKISDFGLAKFYSTEKNIVTLTAARGTIGYVAPELINRSIGGVSYKADVYSFGMLLVELVGLKRSLAKNDDNSSTQYFPHWIYDCLNKGKDIDIAKTDDIVDENMGEITRRMTIVALWCIQLSPDDRPSMSKVLEMLESDVELLQIPPEPSEVDEKVAQHEDQTWDTYSTDSAALLCDGSTLSHDL
ncbi:LEAF RUST 10 DISEASE-RESISTANCEUS RECEPTOR-LIKE PROTEIN KINASE-like 2.1 [Primulina eburnea]|uniref:LEAF RUST 10 DISEASE-RESISTANCEUS RECEPTOR-LIKE PROTEIN KINASE-like 2.1 n=1 Tax=Primulina eburnea TaxID=1245227 RepID=UPI003C6C9167